MLRGALLGAGNIAQQGHLPVYLAAPEVRDRCRLVAVADLSAANLAHVGGLLPAIRAFTSAEALLREIRPDFVDICAPPHAHHELVRLALEHHCHILCEKPLSLNLSDAEALAACVRESDVVFMPGHQYHYAPAWQTIRDLLHDGAIGRPWFGAVTIQRTKANDGNQHWNPSWRTSEALSGGGILMDHGTHLFYQLQALFGPPRRVAARIDTRRHFGYSVEDTVCCYVDYGSASVRIMLTWAGARRVTTHHYFGSSGQIVCQESSIRVTSSTGDRCLQVADGFSGNSSHSAWYAPLLDDFLNRIERADRDRGPLNEAVATVKCAAAVYESARTGCAVNLE